MNQEMLETMFAPPDIMKCKKVLCIQPHPDDCEIGMGAIIGKLTETGCRVDYLTITDGALGTYDRELVGEKLTEIRKQEAIKAGKTLGVSEFHWFEKEDGTLNDIPKLAGEIAELIRENKYDGICAPDPWLNYEAHYDHVVTGKATAQAFINVSLAEYPKGTKTEICNPQVMCFYFTASPNSFIDVTSTFEKRFEAMAMHKSQITPELLEMYRMYFTGKAMKIGKAMGVAMAEGIRTMNSLHLHCMPEGELIGEIRLDDVF